jgi:hypothetical protein
MENSKDADTKFKKGQKSGPGRPKGTKNKATAELKEMILCALDASGGVDYLVERANDPRTASSFLALIGKVLPMTVQGPNPDGSHTFTVNQPWLQQSIQQRNSA